MKEKIDMQSGKDPGAPFVIDGRDLCYLRKLLEIATDFWRGNLGR